MNILKFRRIQVLKDSVTPACVGKQSREILHCAENLTLHCSGWNVGSLSLLRDDQKSQHPLKPQQQDSSLSVKAPNWTSKKKISKHRCANKASLLWLENLFRFLTRPVSRCPNYIVIGNTDIPTENKTLLCHM